MINPIARAHQIMTLARSRCIGCRHCADILVAHHESITLTCHLCRSSYDVTRDWTDVVLDPEAA